MNRQTIPGYVRTEVIHATDTWRVEIDSDDPPVGALIVETADGSVTFALTERVARDAIAALREFLGDPG